MRYFSGRFCKLFAFPTLKYTLRSESQLTLIGKAEAAEGEASVLKKELDELLSTNAKLRNQITRTQEERQEMVRSAQQYISQHGSVEALLASDDANGIVDPRRVARQHKNRPSPGPEHLEEMVKMRVKSGVGQINTLLVTGVVISAPKYGYIGPVRKKGTVSSNVGTEVLQFELQEDGYRVMPYPSSSAKPYRNMFLVELRQKKTALDIREGDTIVVVGHYGVHAVFELDSNQWEMHPVLDVGDSGYVGLLGRKKEEKEEEKPARIEETVE